MCTSIVSVVWLLAVGSSQEVYDSPIVRSGLLPLPLTGCLLVMSSIRARDARASFSARCWTVSDCSNSSTSAF